MKNTTDFGFQQVPEDEKERRVAGVFDSVARRYDVMNDLMSAGLHRYWKRFTIAQSMVRPGERVLDVAGGTGDLARLFAQRVGEAGSVVLTDINASMLSIGRDRMVNEGLVMPVALCSGERLPFAPNTFDCVSVCSAPAAGFSCSSSQESPNRSRPSTTRTPSRSCRGSAHGLQVTARAIAISLNRSACIRNRKHSKT
jgi:SAM-dependent methyltransferase